MKAQPRNLKDENDRRMNELERYKTILDYHLNSKHNTIKNGLKNERIFPNIIGTFGIELGNQIKSNYGYVEEIINVFSRQEGIIDEEEGISSDLISICSKLQDKLDNTRDLFKK